MYDIVLNKNKSIGKVVFIVEGDKKEHTLLRHIFTNVMDYSVVDVKRQKSPCEKYVSNKNPDSRIFVVSAENSNIKSAGESGKDYLDRVFTTLYRDYALDTTNAAVYYIFDRDNESNMYSETENLMHILKNSRDNGVESNGLLLLSYPCIEAYIKLCFEDYINETVDSPASLKKLIGSGIYQYKKMSEKEIIRSCNNMLLGIKSICGRELSETDLDDFGEIGNEILSEENDLYMEKNQYVILSLLSVVFLDLGILEMRILSKKNGHY